MGVAELVREVLEAHAGGTAPDEQWLRDRFSVTAMATLDPAGLSSALLGLVPPLWEEGRGLVLEEPEGLAVGGRLGGMQVHAVALAGDPLRLDTLWFSTPQPPPEPTAQGVVEARLRELLAAYEGATPQDAWTEGFFSPEFLQAVPVAQLHAVLARLVAAHWAGGGGLQVTREEHGRLVGSFGGELEVSATLAEGRFTGLLFKALGTAVDDERVADLPVSVSATREVAAAHGLVGFTAAGPDWSCHGGFTDLDSRTEVTAGTVLAAYSVTKLVTATAVLALVSRGSVDLDRPANDYLERVRLDSDAVTVRHLLTHTGGVASAFDHFAAAVPDAVDVLGRVVATSGPPGERFAYSNGGFALLGLVLEAVAGAPYEQVVADHVLTPLGMATACFPSTALEHGYDVRDGRLRAVDRVICTVPAAGGMWCRPSDLVAFAQGWRSCMAEELAAEAIVPPAGVDTRTGFAWVVGDAWLGHAGGGPGFRASLLVHRDSDRPLATLVNRAQVAVEAINVGLEEACR